MSHDVVSDYLKRERLTARHLWELVAGQIEDSPDAYLIIDDSVQDKRYSRSITCILIIILGDTPLPKIIIVILITFFPILANVTKGLKSADSVLLDRMQTLDSSQWEIFTKVRWPSALPYYIAAHEIAFTGSIIGAVVAEWLFARQGLGYLIVQSMSQYRADRVWAVTILASALAVGAYLLVRLIERYLFRWQVEDLT